MRILGKEAGRLARTNDVKKAMQELLTDEKESTQREEKRQYTTTADGKIITFRRVTIDK